MTDRNDRRTKDPLVDRRSGFDRREAYDLDYFRNGGGERRSGKERRHPHERRDQCVRISRWSSICVDEVEE
jgi:hypothetical protein